MEIRQNTHIYILLSIEKQVLTTYTNLSQFCFLGTTLVPTDTTNCITTRYLYNYSLGAGVVGQVQSSKILIPSYIS